MQLEVLPLSELIYLDNSATTAVCPTAIEYINSALINYGNPSSLHVMGMVAEDELIKTRNAVSSVLGCKSDEIYFTSGGTEANNTSILGAVYARRKRGNRIVTTAIEHPSVLEVCARLEEEGFEVIRLTPDENGSISESALSDAINDNTILVSLMLVNNETGAILPVRVAREIIKRKNAPALLHCDAVQAFGKVPCSVSKLGVDLLSASAHKINGPKGIGFLYKSKNVHIKPLILGGGQESGLRSGTESVPLIAGLRGALEEMPSCDKFLSHTAALREIAIEKLTAAGIAEINSPENAAPYILNFSVNGYRSETLLHFLESKSIFVSSGSACAKGKGSHVLRAMGLPQQRVDSALRISFGRYNKAEDIDMLVSALIEATQKLRGRK